MPETLRKFSLAQLSTDGLADKRQVLVNCSAESLDRQGDIVVQSGIQTGNFLKTGGTVLWNHDPSTPVAKALSVGVDSGQLRGLAQFPDPGVSPKADEIYGLVKAGIVNSVSIGFKPLEWEPLDPKEPWNGQKYLSVELMEFSFVSVPAQAEATVIARANGESRAANGDIRSPLATRNSPFWKVGASLNLPIGDDEDWDGPAAEASIFEHADFGGDDADVAFVRKGFLAYDSAAPKLKGSYELPFAKIVDGRLTAMPSGIRAAASRLPDAGISDDAKAKARAVIDHYEAKMSDKSWAKVKSALRASAEPETVALIKSWHEAHKAGRVLSEENLAHVKGLQKCLSAMADCQTKGMQACGAANDQMAKALDSHGVTHAQLEAFRDHLNTAEAHAKSLMGAAKKPKPADDATDDENDYSDPDSEDSDVELAALAARRKRMIEIAEVGSRQ